MFSNLLDSLFDQGEVPQAFWDQNSDKLVFLLSFGFVYGQLFCCRVFFDSSNREVCTRGDYMY